MSLSTFWLSESSMLMFLKTLNKILYVPFSCPKWMKLIKLSSLNRIRTIQSKEQWITNLWYWYYLNPIILSFPSKPSLKYVFRLKAAWRVTLFANDWQLLKSRLIYRALLSKTEIWPDLNFWHTTSLYLLKIFCNIGHDCETTFSTKR